MYQFIKLLPLRWLLAEQLPVMALSLFIAELFYKFHSFTLEMLAFLATWFVLDALVSGLIRLFGRKR